MHISWEPQWLLAGDELGGFALQVGLQLQLLTRRFAVSGTPCKAWRIVAEFTHLLDICSWICCVGKLFTKDRQVDTIKCIYMSENVAALLGVFMSLLCACVAMMFVGAFHSCEADMLESSSSKWFNSRVQPFNPELLRSCFAEVPRANDEGLCRWLSS